MNNRPKRFAGLVAVVVVVQTLALIAMVAAKQYTLATGTPIVLKIEPLDPRSLFRGDYVNLSYSISRLHPFRLFGEEDFSNNQQVHVVLEPGKPFWRPVSVHHQWPEVKPGQIVLVGKVGNISEYKTIERQWGAYPMDVRYGIESYFIPEDKGRALEQPGEEDVLSIRIAVDASGKAGILAVLINGEERYQEPLF